MRTDNRIQGYFEWKLVDEDGGIAAEGGGKNLVVDNGKRLAMRDNNVTYPVGRYIFIADDAPGGTPRDVTPNLNILKSAVGTGSNFENVRIDTGTGGWDRPSLTRTVSVTFLAPISQRQVTHIGTTFNGGWSSGANASTIGTHGNIFSALKIDPPIIQEVTQTLEITYKLVILPVTDKSLERWPKAGRDINRMWLESYVVDHYSTSNEPQGWIMPYTFGRYHFIDGGALMPLGYVSNTHYAGTFPTVIDLGPASNVQYKASSVTRLAATSAFYNGAWGMSCSGLSHTTIPSGANTRFQFSGSASHGYYALAQDWGKVGPLVFPHPIQRSSLFNEVAVDKTGQGDLEISGPYIPADAGNGAPQHWAYHVAVTDSGDADPGTEGAYVFSRLAWYSYPFNAQARARSGSGSYTYVADGGGGNSEITQASGDFRVTDSFSVDSRLEVSGTVSNNGTTYKIIKVQPLRITLEGIVLTGEGPVSSSLSAVDLFVHDSNGDRLIGGSAGTQGWRISNLRTERNTTAEGTNSPRTNAYRLVWDGMDTYWGLVWRNTGHAGNLNFTGLRWRAMTGEQEFRGFPNALNPGIGANGTGDPFTDDTRFVLHADGSPVGNGVNIPYALASDGAGLVFYGERDGGEGSSTNRVFIIDNSRPGRWYQRPSGSVTAGGIFTVDVDDAIHDMFPFVGGDSGGVPQIRIVNSNQGNDGVYPVSSFTNSNEVTITGAFTAESNIEWHWTTVDTSQPAVGALNGFVYDKVNGRLWVLGSMGIKHSDDNGQSWSTLLDDSTSVTPLIDADSLAASVGSVDGGHGGYDLDANGDLYWVTNDGVGETWINKLELNSGIGVDSVHSRVGLIADLPGSNKPPYNLFQQVFWEKGVDNANGLGALWFISSSNEAEDSWYRMTVDAGVISAAPQIAKILEHNPQTINNITSGYDAATQMFTTQGGTSYLRETTSGVPWITFDPRYADEPDDAYMDAGGISSNTSGYLGSLGQEAMRPDGCFLLTMGSNEYGFFGSLQQYFRYAPSTDIGGQSGAAASIVAGAPSGQIRVQGLTGMTADSIGRHLAITGSASGNNNNIFIIAARNSATEVDVFAPSGVTGDANNGSISWQEKGSEWVAWDGSGNQFNAWYGTVSGGRRPMHADSQELRDNVQVKFTEAGGATAPVDEFVEGESFTFIASFGEHKTNTEDMTISGYNSFGPSQTITENEPVKIATGPGAINAYHREDDEFTVVSPVLLDPTYILDANGGNWGWSPARTYGLYGQGLTPDSGPTTTTRRPSFRTGLDLGAGPPEINKLVIVINHGDNDFLSDGTKFVYGTADTGRYIDMAVYTAPDLVTLPSEVDINLRWPNGNLANYIQIEQNTAAWTVENYDNYMIVIDLAGAGLSVGQRTARFWEVAAAMHGSAPDTNVNLAGVWALDASNNVVGLNANHRVDEALDSDFNGANINQAFWIQNLHGGGDPGAGTVISTTDDGDGDGRTSVVTLDSGTFDTSSIDITQDFLAWNENGNPSASGYMRAADKENLPVPRALTSILNSEYTARSPQLSQAMSRIIDISTPGEITVEDDMIPDGLSGVEWEVRRPAILSGSASGSTIEDFGYDVPTGFFRHNPANITANRRFRITQKTVFRK